MFQNCPLQFKTGVEFMPDNTTGQRNLHAQSFSKMHEKLRIAYTTEAVWVSLVSSSRVQLQRQMDLSKKEASSDLRRLVHKTRASDEPQQPMELQMRDASDRENHKQV